MISPTLAQLFNGLSLLPKYNRLLLKYANIFGIEIAKEMFPSEATFPLFN